MQCPCGDSTLDHKVVRKKELVGEYMKCRSCGKTAWLWKTKGLEKELADERST